MPTIAPRRLLLVLEQLPAQGGPSDLHQVLARTSGRNGRRSPRRSGSAWKAARRSDVRSGSLPKPNCEVLKGPPLRVNFKNAV